ncbi:addiction module protein [Lacunimicrobium album]
MSQTAEEVVSAALHLSEQDRLAVVAQILQSMNPDIANADEELWLNELERRRKAYRNDPSRGISWEELKSEIDA